MGLPASTFPPCLIVAATSGEVAPLEPLIAAAPHCQLLVTGAGMTATACRLSRALALRPYGFVLNLGIAGSYRDDWPPGTVVEVVDERFGDFGAEDLDRFLDAFDLGLADPNEDPFVDGRIQRVHGAIRLPTLDELAKAHGLTVNTVRGREESIRETRSRFQADVESMEGAAIFYACTLAGVPCAQVRSISNPVSPRDRRTWDLPLAVRQLHAVGTWLIDDLGKATRGEPA